MSLFNHFILCQSFGLTKKGAGETTIVSRNDPLMQLQVTNEMKP